MNQRDLLRERLLRKRGIRGAGPEGVPLSPEFLDGLEDQDEEAEIAATQAMPPMAPEPRRPLAPPSPPRRIQPPPDVVRLQDRPAPRVEDDFVPPEMPVVPEQGPPAVGAAEPGQPDFTSGRPYGLDLPEIPRTNRGDLPGDPVASGKMDPRERLKKMLMAQDPRERAFLQGVSGGRELQGENQVAAALSRMGAAAGRVHGAGPESGFDAAGLNKGVEGFIGDITDAEKRRQVLKAKLLDKKAATAGKRHIVTAPNGDILEFMDDGSVKNHGNHAKASDKGMKGFTLGADQERWEPDENGGYKKIAGNPKPQKPLTHRFMPNPVTGEIHQFDPNNPENPLVRTFGERKPSKAVESYDMEFGKGVAEMDTKGIPTLKRNADDLRDAVGRLKNVIEAKNGGNVSIWDRVKGEMVSGPIANLTPDFARNWMNEEAQNIRDLADKTTVENLRPTLGAQFTLVENREFKALEFNPGVSEEENLRRLEKRVRVIDQMVQQAEKMSQDFHRSGGRMSRYRIELTPEGARFTPVQGGGSGSWEAQAPAQTPAPKQQGAMGEEADPDLVLGFMEANPGVDKATATRILQQRLQKRRQGR